MNLEEQIRSQLNIVEVISEYIPLSKKGNNYWGICPFHQDSNPSMSVNPQKNYFKCFTCGKGGHVDEFVQYYEKISHGSAIEKLAAKLGIVIEKNEDEIAKYSEGQQKLINIFYDAINFYQLSIDSQFGEKALAYANSRGLDSAVRSSFKIGYAHESEVIDFLRAKGHNESDMINASLLTSSGKPFNTNRLIFGITNEFGDVVALSARLISGEGPKYINSAESLVFHKSSILYNFHNALDSIKKEKEVYVLEGFMDVIAMHKVGITNSVAIMGTSLTKEHLSKLKGNLINLMLDSDKAGIDATLKSIRLLISNQFSTNVIINSIGKDADEILSTLGKEKLINIATDKIPALEFVYKHLKEKYTFNSLTDIELFFEDFGKYIYYGNDMEKSYYAGLVSRETNLSLDAVISKFPKIKTVYRDDSNDVVIPKNNRVIPNNNYRLLKTILSKPSLAAQLKKNPVFFDDAVLLTIAKYCVIMSDPEFKNRKEKITFDKEVSQKVKEIMDHESQVVETPEEVDDLIDIINKHGSKNQIKTLDVKLSNVNSDEEGIKILKQMGETKRRERDKNGKGNK